MGQLPRMSGLVPRGFIVETTVWKEEGLLIAALRVQQRGGARTAERSPIGPTAATNAGSPRRYDTVAPRKRSFMA